MASETAPSVPPSMVPSTVVAALLLLARSFLERLDLPRPSAAAIFEATQGTRSRAYELKDTLEALLPSVVQPVGRPRKEVPTPAPEGATEVTRKVLEYLYAHPGAATHTGNRRFYSDRFRRFVLELHAETDLDRDVFARAVCVPLGTLDDWLRTPAPPKDDEASPSAEPSPTEQVSLHIQTIVAAWQGWRGSFMAILNHLKDNLRISYGPSFVARVLFVFNERTPQRRAGRSPDEEATCNSFKVFFPNAQWVGDGMRVPVTINGTCYHFNLEFSVDAYSGAFVSASIRDEEDSQAVIEAFKDGVDTTGTAPLALLLDNRSSNHTAEVDEALGGTMRMRSTLERPQNKAHVEGAFGLFSQHAPPLDVAADSSRALAKEILRLRVQTFARTLNHRPRRDREWRSRIDLHDSKTPTEDEVKAARAALEVQRQKRERALANDLNRTDPATLKYLDDAFARLSIVDPNHHARSAIARYGREVVIEAVAIFEGKLAAGTLDDGVDAAPYILGIARNIALVHEAYHITQALVRSRIEVRDSLLAGLRLELEGLLSKSDHSPRRHLQELIDRALSANRTIDQLFWVDATGQLLSRQPAAEHPALFREIARRIHATFALRPHERSMIVRRLARVLWPLS